MSIFLPKPVLPSCPSVLTSAISTITLPNTQAARSLAPSSLTGKVPEYFLTMNVIRSSGGSLLALESVSLGIQFCFCHLPATCEFGQINWPLQTSVSGSVKDGGSHYTLRMYYKHNTLLAALCVLTHFILMTTL